MSAGVEAADGPAAVELAAGSGGGVVATANVDDDSVATCDLTMLSPEMVC